MHCARPARSACPTSNMPRPTSSSSVAIGRTFDVIEFERGAASSRRSVCRMARATVAAAAGRLHGGRTLQRDGARRHRQGAKLHRGTRLRFERRRHPPLPARPDHARGRQGVSRCLRVDRFLQHQRLPRPAVPRAGAPPDGSRRSPPSLSRMHSILSASISRQAVASRYRALYPADTAMTDLASWDEFERQHPSSFAGMYQFWVQKRV